jgi:hypothetical protein
MVQFFGPTSAALQRGKLGEAIGEGLSKRMGLAEAENMAKQADGDPVKLAFSLAKASMHAPEMQRSLGQIYEQLLSRTNASQLGSGLTNDPQNIPGSINTPGAERNPDLDGEISPTGVIPTSTDVPSNASPLNREIAKKDPIEIPRKGNYNADDIENISHQFLVDMRPDLMEGSSQYGRIPTFNYEMKSNLRPEEEGQLRQKLQSQKINPKVIDQIVEKTREDVNTRYNEYLKNFNMDANRQTEIRDKWDKFKQESDRNLEPFIGKYGGTLGVGGRPATANDLRNKYFQYAGNLPVNLTPEQMNAQATALLQNDVNRIDALAAVPKLPYVRDPKDIDNYLEDNKEAYKNLYQEGFYESLKEDAASKDMGLEELHSTIWGDQTDKNSLNSVASLKSPEMYLNGTQWDKYDPFSTKILKANPKYPQERKKYIDNLSKRLERIKPDDDLILLRGQVLNSNGTEKDFNEALDKAINNGLTLSQFQRSQRQETRIPRMRPIWEIFNPNAWKSWMARKRGKR